MKQKDVQKKIDVILDNIDKLHILKSKPYQEFASDFRNIDSTLHRMQTSIQALLDIGGYIIASLGLRTPNTNAEIVEILVEAGHIPREKEETYIKMSQFRNRIVHLYNRLDNKVLYDILINEVDDIKELYTGLLDILDEHGKEERR